MKNRKAVIIFSIVPFSLAMLLFNGVQNVGASKSALGGTDGPNGTATPIGTTVSQDGGTPVPDYTTEYPPGTMMPVTPDQTGTGTPTPTGTAGGGTVITNISQVFHHLVFPSNTISDALVSIFSNAAKQQTSVLVKEEGVWFQTIGEIIQAPSAGIYSRVATSSLPVAAALAPALFIFRIVLYNWNKLVGEQDSIERTLGDILISLIIAVLCGWLLDLVVRLGWWMTGAAIGEAAGMAKDFVKSMTVEGIIQNGASIMSGSIFLPLLFIAVELGALVALAGMLLAFAAANAGLFLLAVLGPSLAVLSVLPQMRWLRSLWLKAVTVISLLPLVAGSVFKAGVYMANLFDRGGLLAFLIHILWLWGASGAMLSLAGILSKLTIATTTDAIGQALNAVKAIVGTAAMVATGAGAVGAVGAGAGAVGGAAAMGGSAAASGGAEAAASGAEGLASSASGHLSAAQAWNTRAGFLDAFGMRGASGLARMASQNHSLAARQDELTARMGRLTGGGRGGDQVTPGTTDLGFTQAPPDMATNIQRNSGLEAGQIRELWDGGLRGHFTTHNIAPQQLATAGSVNLGNLFATYNQHRDSVDSAPDPLGNLSNLLRDGNPIADLIRGNS